MSGNSQTLSVLHAGDGAFDGGGLRSQFVYRDLGIKAATGGRYHAHIIKAGGAGGPGIGLHRHTGIDFQMVYVLKGWMRFWYEGRGETLAEAGACILQPPGIAHDVLEWSKDLELLEVLALRLRHRSPGRRCGQRIAGGQKAVWTTEGRSDTARRQRAR